MDNTEAGNLIAAIGPQDDRVAAIVEIADDNWVVRFEDIDVELEFDAGGQRLMLAVALGTPSAERRAAIHETALAYALMWRETGGVRIARAGVDGSLILMADLAVSELSAGVVAAAVGNMAAKARIWRAIVAGAGETQAAAEPGADLVFQA